MPTNPERVFSLLVRQAPHPFCDDCIAKEAGISPRQQVNPITGALGLTREFERHRGTCHHCKGLKLVTKAVRC